MSAEHKITTGDLFASGAQTLVNAVNCCGIMGAGIAKAFKERYPVMFEDYQQRCRRGEVVLGYPYLWVPEGGGIHILNFPTKRHWRDVARLPPIVDGLQYLTAHYREWGITSIALPALGCGLGGLNFEAVRPVMLAQLRQLDIPVALYRPQR